jgi:hypothetical protein
MILGRRLQALREKAGLSYEKAGEAIYASAWTIRRMEKAEGGLKLNNVKGLLAAYGVTDPGEVDAFLTLARRANARGWWHGYADVLPGWFQTFVGIEEAAGLIRAYEPQAVPGLLQTADYARALTRAGFPAAPEGEIDRRVELRLARQALLTRPDPPRLWVVVDEAVLHRRVGGRAVLGAQLDRLIEATALPNVTVQVLRPDAGAHPAMFGPFHVLRFPAAELGDVVYVETMTGAVYLDKQSEVDAYLDALGRICTQAAPAETTASILHDIRESI